MRFGFVVAIFMVGKAVVRFFIAARIAAGESERLAKFSGGTVIISEREIVFERGENRPKSGFASTD